MPRLLNAKQLRGSLPAVVESVKRGERYTLVYRSEPVLQLVPLDAAEKAPGAPEDDALFGAEALGSSRDGLTAADHDDLLYAVAPAPVKRPRRR